jgi:acetate---CoA ligase (ADP-forming)
MSHKLDPLLKPESVALVGASERENSPGRVLANMVINSEFGGDIYPINPGYQSIFGKPCYTNLDALPKKVDHVIIALGVEKLEASLRAAIEHGARAATIFSSTTLERDVEPHLQTRLTTMAEAAGIHICGANGMGFYNIPLNLYAGMFQRPETINSGGVSHIAQSGTAFATLAHNGCRLGFNLCVSSGNEMTTTVADYMDWSLEQPDTRVISLFLETVRDPESFVSALGKAQSKQIPIVALKIGKTPLAAKMAISHTGAIAGNHAAFEALFKRFGVIEVQDLDELAATLMLLQNGPSTHDGQFAAVFESGGLREMMTDLAHELEIDFAPIEAVTQSEISHHLDPGLKAENPLDAWGSHHRFEERFTASLKALMLDPNVAGGAFFSIFRDDYFLHEAIYRVVETVSREVDKPIALATTYADLDNEKLSRRAFEAGIPLIEGARESLLAFKHLFEYQRQLKEPLYTGTESVTDNAKSSHCRELFKSGHELSFDENKSLELLSSFGIPVVTNLQVSDKESLIRSSREMKYPLVLKTAEPGINHKSDSNGVFVNISEEVALIEHYSDLCSRLGPTVQIAEMINNAVEISLGCIHDPQFGPFIMISAGGVLVELLNDRKVALCPISDEEAFCLVNELKVSRLLNGYRGKPAVNINALVKTIVQFSEFATEFQEYFSEIDINPLLINTEGCYAVDALIAR